MNGLRGEGLKDMDDNQNKAKSCNILINRLEKIQQVAIRVVYYFYRFSNIATTIILAFCSPFWSLKAMAVDPEKDPPESLWF